jgi:hypothetical protein
VRRLWAVCLLAAVAVAGFWAGAWLVARGILG